MNVTFETADPGSLEVLATVCEMGQAEVAMAVDAAHAAFQGDAQKSWKDTSIEERCELVMKLVELCERDRDVFLACEIFDGGKVSELAEGDFGQIRACAEYFCQVAKRAQMGDGEAMQVAAGVRGFTYREPWGVVAGIIPWNYPIVLNSWFLFPRCFPATHPPQTRRGYAIIGSLHRQAGARAGFPPGVFNVLPGRGEITGQFIAEHPGVRFISFTGSPGVGQSIMRTCDMHGTRMKREMGGNGAAIVLDDADPELVARQIAATPISTTVKPAVQYTASSWTRELPTTLSTLNVTSLKICKLVYQADAGTQLGAVVNSTQHARILAAQEETACRGGHAILPGGIAEISDRQGYYLKPALYRTQPGVNCNPAEVFHTFATICPVASAEQALELANSSPYGLGASVWTRDTERGVALAKAVPRWHLPSQLSQLDRLRIALRRPGHFRRARWWRELRGNVLRLHAGQSGLRERVSRHVGRLSASRKTGKPGTTELSWMPSSANPISKN